MSQRTQTALLVGMCLAGEYPIRPDQQERRTAIAIANASTIPTLWAQSSPGLRVNWEGRDQLPPPVRQPTWEEAFFG